MNCDDSKNRNTIESAQQQVVSSLLSSSISCEQEQHIIQSQQIVKSHYEINEKPDHQQHQNEQQHQQQQEKQQQLPQHLTLQQQQSLNVSINTILTSECPKSSSTTMTPTTTSNSMTTPSTSNTMTLKKRLLVQNPYASKKRSKIENDKTNNDMSIRVSVDDQQRVSGNDDFMNQNDCVELWNLPLGEPSQQFYLRPNHYNHNINSVVQNNIPTTISDMVTTTPNVADSILDPESHAKASIVTTIDDIKTKIADTTIIQKHDIPYWMRLPSRTLSFGSAEIMLISELWQQQLEQKRPKKDSMPQRNDHDDQKDKDHTSFSYATKSYRMTGILLYQQVYSDTSISMLLGDPLETDSIECRSVSQADHVVLYRKANTSEGSEHNTSRSHNNVDNGMKTPSHATTKNRQYLHDQSSRKKDQQQQQNEKTPYLLLDRSQRKKITPVYRKKVSSSSLSSSVLKPSYDNNNPTTNGQGKRKIVKKRLRFSLLLQKHQDDEQKQNSNDEDGTYDNINNLVDDNDTNTKHIVQISTAMTLDTTSDCNKGCDIMDNSENVFNDHNSNSNENDNHSVSLAQSLTSSIQSVLSSTVNAAMSIFQSSSYEETEAEHQKDKINSSQKKVDCYTDNDDIYDRILLEDDTKDNDDRDCRTFHQQPATVTPTNKKLDDNVPSSIIANTLLDNSRFQNQEYSTFRKCIWIVIPPSHTISHVDTCRVNDLVMIIGELRNLTVHNASNILRRHDDVAGSVCRLHENTNNGYNGDDMAGNNNSSNRLNAVMETIQSMQNIHDQKINKEKDQFVISSKDYDRGDYKENHDEEKLCIDQYEHGHENRKNGKNIQVMHDENKLYSYIEARIVRNVNGTNMKLYTDALMARRTFLSNRSSIWK